MPEPMKTPTCAALAGERTSAASSIANCEAAIARGYRDIKLHEITLPEIEIAREASGPDVRIMCDCNCPWTVWQAIDMARKLEGRSTRFDMVLTPEDLGRVDVSLEIGSDGQLAARLAFDNPAAAAELRGRADELRRQLQDAGFQLSNDSLDFTQRDSSSGGGFERQHQQRQALFTGAARLTAETDLPVSPPPGAWTNHSQTRDRVDVRV